MFPNEIVVEQGSEAWLNARAGHVTMSRLDDLLAGKGAREAYMWEIATERIYKTPKESATSRSLEWGHDSEPLAREEYVIRTGRLVRECGFIHHEKIRWVGCSLDGAIDADTGTYESKCPKNSDIHMRTWHDGMPAIHIAQVQGGMWVTGLQYCDFVSYDVRAPYEFQLYVERIHRDESLIRAIEAKVKTFLAEVNVLERELRKRAKNAIY